MRAPFNASPARFTDAQLAAAPRRTRFTPVLVRLGGQWRFGVLERWVRMDGPRWVAYIRYDVGGPTAFEFRNDGSIVPLALAENGAVPVLRPLTHPAGR